MPKAIVIIATHKRYRMPEDPLYLPLQVGAAGKSDLGYQRDDEGENISEKNTTYCELTGLYWAWKHLDADFIGLAHYRRHFAGKRGGMDPMQRVLTERELRPLLAQYDVFVPKKRHYVIETLESHYAHTHDATHIVAAREAVRCLAPEYLDDFDEIIRRRAGYMFNMVMMRRALLDQYCSWLFAILEELEKEIDTSRLSAFHARVFGRISEILFNVWLVHKKKAGEIRPERICELPIVYLEKINWLKKGSAFLAARFAGKKYEGSF